ncbi:helix-turn-helix domain-containing protein [Streptomyces sp. MAR4 CNY-716]
MALADSLREIRARTGLSLSALAERTPYSKSSWQRYLNGKKEIPRQAVEALCALAGEPAGRLLALWELADAEWSGRARSTSPAAPAPPAPADAGRAGAPHGRRQSRWWHPSIASMALAAMTVLAYAALSLTGTDTGGPAGPAASEPDTPVGCQGKACDGKDPDAMFCGLPDRVEVIGPQRHTVTGAGLEIRYSASCAAGWGRIWSSAVGDRIEISAPGARPRSFTARNKKDTVSYRFTPMIGGADPDSLQLCFLPASGAPRKCFRS